jgi:hypothetical protein
LYTVDVQAFEAQVYLGVWGNSMIVCCFEQGNSSLTFCGAILLCHQISSRWARACILAVRSSCQNRKFAIKHGVQRVYRREWQLADRLCNICHLMRFPRPWWLVATNPGSPRHCGTPFGAWGRIWLVIYWASDWLESSWQRQ